MSQRSISDRSQKPSKPCVLSPSLQIFLTTCRAIDNGANALAEGFLFAVAAALIIGETWRTARNQSKRRDSVDDQLEDLGGRLTELNTRVDSLVGKWDSERDFEKQRCVFRCWSRRVALFHGRHTRYVRRADPVMLYDRNDELQRILERVVEIGLRGGWAEFEGNPIQLPIPSLVPPRPPTNASSVPAPEPATTSGSDSTPPASNSTSSPEAGSSL